MVTNGDSACLCLLSYFEIYFVFTIFSDECEEVFCSALSLQDSLIKPVMVDT